MFLFNAYNFLSDVFFSFRKNEGLLLNEHQNLHIWHGDLTSDAIFFEKLYATLENLRDFVLLLRNVFFFFFFVLSLSQQSFNSCKVWFQGFKLVSILYKELADNTITGFIKIFGCCSDNI